MELIETGQGTKLFSEIFRRILVILIEKDSLFIKVLLKTHALNICQYIYSFYACNYSFETVFHCQSVQLQGSTWSLEVHKNYCFTKARHEKFRVGT